MQIKHYAQLSLVSILLTTPLPLLAGNLEPPSDPTSYSGYTLQDICNRLDDGTAGSQTTFQEPADPPADSASCTLNEVMNKTPAKDNTDGAEPSDVATGKKYWGLKDGIWGPQTGTNTGPTCSKTPNGTRWCDNGDGTVTDLTTGLIWLQKADWGGTKQWDGNNNDNAFVRAGILKNGEAGANLSDGSVEGDWRLPTKKELVGITTGTEPVSSSDTRAFSGVQTSLYWSSATVADNPGLAWCVSLGNGFVYNDGKAFTYYVWPVRGGE